MADTRIKLRRGSKAEWVSLNPKPEAGEACFATDTNELKIGNGIDFYNDLPYINPQDVVLEAPQDGKPYVRIDGEWQEIVADVEEAPEDGNQYARKDGGWVQVTAEVEEAPIDNKQYGRQDGQWEEILGDTDVRNVKLLSYFLGG
jgi:hypothetical protein